jgi:glycosyltransferase involved in cell wall biosynthesis
MKTFVNISIVGTRGIPARYGGFETLVENLVKYQNSFPSVDIVTVYCSGLSSLNKDAKFLTANLKYIPLKANGLQSIPYDIFSLLISAWRGSDVILLLGVSGAIVLPLLRCFSSVRIITNIDGIEWRREKWSRLVKLFLRFSEKIAVLYSHAVIADNEAIAEHVTLSYGASCHVIAYGGDHVISVVAKPLSNYQLPQKYALSICRIEPENNLHLILQAFSKTPSTNLIVVGNWGDSEYGIELRRVYSTYENIFLLDPIYDLGELKTLRTAAVFYVHGHSAGGTNPSLVEAMYFGMPILAFDCKFNRFSTEGAARYFNSDDQLIYLINTICASELERLGNDMLEIAIRRYSWDIIGKQYFNLFGSV